MIKNYKLFLESNGFDDVKYTVKPIMDDIEDEYGFDCVYHKGGSNYWPYTCDLALAISLQGNIDIYDKENLKPVGVEEIKKKYDFFYQIFNENTFLKIEGVRISGMIVYFKEDSGFGTFSNVKFLSWEEFCIEISEGDYYKKVGKNPPLDKCNFLVILFKKYE